MKQTVNPAVMGIIIVVVVAVVALIGYKVFGPQSTATDAAYAKKYGATQKTYSRENPPPGVTIPNSYGGAGGGGYRGTPPPGAHVPGQ